MKCEICKEKCSGKMIVKDAGLRTKTNEIKEWIVCTKCFNLWTAMNFDELTSRWENAQDNLEEAHYGKD